MERCGGENCIYAGSDNTDEVAWYKDIAPGGTREMKSKKANGYGLYDMSGNVCEMCVPEKEKYTHYVE